MTTAVPPAGDRPDPAPGELLDQLEALFLAEGFARFTLDELALRLRCSKSTLYALAGSKEQLAQRVIKHFFRKATDAVEARTVTVEDPALRVTAYLTAVAAALAPAGPAFHRDLTPSRPGGRSTSATRSWPPGGCASSSPTAWPGAASARSTPPSSPTR